MRISCYRIDDLPFDIRPASKHQFTLPKTVHEALYHGSELANAQSIGWYLYSVESFEAIWDGNIAPEGVKISSVEGDQPPFSSSSNFGNGILTFSGRAIFRTPPEYNLCVMGPPNQSKDSLQPLMAIVEADWIPFVFTMNWLFTRKDVAISFKKGEPYSYIFPIKRGLVETIQPKIKVISPSEVLNYPENVLYEWKLDKA